MTAIIRERQVTDAQQEMLDLEEMAPDKFDPEIQFKISKHENNEPREVSYGQPLTREQVAKLLNASSITESQPEEREITRYPTLDRETAQRLVREHYEYIANAKKKKQEQENLWDSLKTTESETKTVKAKKRGTSTKA